MAENNYAKKLTDPRWQRKRLEVFERDNFTCVFCKSKDKELHVHHLEYFGQIEPWEYSLDLMQTLCQECHKKENARGGLEKNLSVAFKLKGFFVGDLIALSCILHENKNFTKNLLKALREYGTR